MKLKLSKEKFELVQWINKEIHNAKKNKLTKRQILANAKIYSFIWNAPEKVIKELIEISWDNVK